MPTTRSIVIYGNTLALSGIAIALQRQPALKVITIEVDAAKLAQYLEHHSPNVIIFDASQTDAQTILSRAEQCHDLLAIGIEANSDRMLLWSGHSTRALTMQDLTQVIDGLPKTSKVACAKNFESLAERVSRLTRRQKLAIAVMTIGLGVIGVLAWSLNISSANVPLVGTAESSGMTSEIALAFGIGIILGAVFIGAWCYVRQARKK